MLMCCDLPSFCVKYRPNGRDKWNMRDIQVDDMIGADGCCRVKSGNSHVICSLYGPRGGRQRYKLSGVVDVFIRFPVLRDNGFCSSQEDMQKIVCCCLDEVIVLDKYPSLEISVCIQILHDGGSIISTCVMSALIAAQSAGIEMNCHSPLGMCVSRFVGGGLIPSLCQEGDLICDCDEEEEASQV